MTIEENEFTQGDFVEMRPRVVAKLKFNPLTEPQKERIGALITARNARRNP